MSTSISIAITIRYCLVSLYITIKSITIPTGGLHKVAQPPVCVIYTNGPGKRCRQPSLDIECCVVSIRAVIQESAVQRLLKMGILVVNMLFHHKTEFDFGPYNVGVMIESVTVQRESPDRGHHGVALFL